MLGTPLGELCSLIWWHFSAKSRRFDTVPCWPGFTKQATSSVHTFPSDSAVNLLGCFVVAFCLPSVSVLVAFAI